MDFRIWERYYVMILDEFGYSRARDERAAAVLDRLLPRRRASQADLKRLISGRTVWIIGNAPSLASDLRTRAIQGTIIVADDAISTVLESGLVPQIVVTDLDGDIDHLLEANRRGSLVVVHAHGDNIEKLQEHAPKFGGSVMGTTQARPGKDIHNFGGFTDGDRAVFMADHFGAREIILLGFDFENVNEQKDAPEKKRKLARARELINVLDNPDITWVRPSPT